ncbi:MAG: Hsp20/alpha crystallin family protein [Lewinellaceae bacterium]|nr:Hsp20/alpha crystallin family protein [Phaeodactylibacter sp.]MCB9348093.1 Hsp20/alpha crystallin family protein [Lewinellaceae bacterium]
MSLVRYNPFATKSVSNFFDDVFNRNITDFFGSDFSASTPSVNVVETENSYRVEVAAPGLEKEDFEVSIDNGFLNISAKKEHQEEVKDGDKYMRREFNFSSFTRSFQLPDTVKADDIAANYENGVLKITLPKKEEAKIEAAKVIDIK